VPAGVAASTSTTAAPTGASATTASASAELSSATAALSALHIARGALSELKAATSHTLAAHALAAVACHHHQLMKRASHGDQFVAFQGSAAVRVETAEQHLDTLRRHRVVHIVPVRPHGVLIPRSIPTSLSVSSARLVPIIVLRLAFRDADAAHERQNDASREKS